MVWGVLMAGILPVRAHTVDQFYMELYPSEQSYRMVLYADAAYCLPEYRGDDDKEAPSRAWLQELSEEEHTRLRHEAEGFVRETLAFMQDEQPLEYQVRFPDYDATPYDFFPSLLDRAILRIEIAGPYLPTGGSMQVSWRDLYKANLLVDIVRGSGDHESRTMLQVDWVEGGNQLDLGVLVYPFDATTEQGAEGRVEVQSRHSWWLYLKIGFDHIVPKGLDHILFVVGLFLFSPRWRPLLHQSLAFTLSHSLTLALSLMGVLSFAGKWVEALIALSIVFIAVENLWARERLARYRLLVVLLFGLIHGLGFGAVLQEFLPRERVFWPLVGFNLGVELGQLLVLGLCFLCCWPLWRQFARIRVAGSVLLALMGGYWVVERVLG